jgi:hypothetical protein
MVTTLIGAAGAYALLRTPGEGATPEAERPPVYAQAETAPVLAPPLTTTLPSTDPAPEVTPAPESASNDAILTPAGSLRLKRLVAAADIDAREPVGASDAFEVGAQERLYAFIEAVNEGDEPAELHVTFEPERGESTGHVTLEVPARAGRYRTWAFTRNAQHAGRWTLIVRDASGQRLGERTIDLVE